MLSTTFCRDPGDLTLRRARRVAVAFVAAAVVVSAAAAAAEPATVRHAGKTIAIKDTLDDPQDLWVHPGDLTRINGFVLKPEGACLADVCIPIRQDRDSDILITRAGAQWFNMSAFARKIQQRVTADYDKRIWTFGPLPFKTSGASTTAPREGVR